MQNCPCMENCPNGCPCPSYTCPEVTTTEMVTTQTTTGQKVLDNVIVLMNRKRPTITDFNGKNDDNFYFMYGDNTVVGRSCALTFQNQLYILGGYGIYNRQISKLVDQELRRVGTLSFDHSLGGCANIGDRKILVCFDEHTENYNQCRFSDEPEGTFVRMPNSTYSHRWVRMAASHSE